ncbi:MAG: LCP family protein [Pisciglobus halotolerans]|nr:LCP family protein [Pisciglobus halotolerans]
MGVDERPGDVGRADTIIVATINPDSNDVKLLSIPRDTLIELPKTGKQDKVNATYAYGGISYVIETVEEYLSVPINYYAKINFQGMVDLVDAVGGIEIDSPLDFTVQDSDEKSNAIVIRKGLQHLQGEKALGYARMRKQDPRGDWGRQERQRQVIEAIVDEAMSISSLTNFKSIFDAISPNLETNLSGREIWIVGTNYASAAKSITGLVLEGEEDRLYFPSYGQEVYVWKPYENKRVEASMELRKHLEIDSAGNENDDYSSDSNSIDSNNLNNVRLK